MEAFKSPYDWRFMVVGGTSVTKYRGFYFCKLFEIISYLELMCFNILVIISSLL